MAGIAAAAFRQSVADMRRPSQAGIVDPTAAAVGAEGLSAAALAADARTWSDLQADDLEILLFSVGAFIEKAGTGSGLVRRLRRSRTTDPRLSHRRTGRHRCAVRADVDPRRGCRGPT